MSWVRLDDGFASHPKMMDAGPLGLAMQVAGLCYCNRYLTDGFVPKNVPSSLLHLDGVAMGMWDNGTIGGGHDAHWELIVEDLVRAGAWEEIDGGWLIHDFADYQPSKEQVLEARRQTRERQLRFRKSRRDKRVTNGENDALVTADVTRESQDPRSRRELLRSSLEERQPKTAAAVPQEPGKGLVDVSRYSGEFVCPICPGGIKKKTQQLLDEHLENVHGVHA